MLQPCSCQSWSDSNRHGTQVNLPSFPDRHRSLAGTVSERAVLRPPVLGHVQGSPWVRLVVVGQSFMLHQIRKMVGLAVAVMRGTAPDYVMPASLSPEHDMHVPMAPEGGLFLERCFFEAYNTRWSHEHGERVDVGLFAHQISAFKVTLGLHFALLDAMGCSSVCTCPSRTYADADPDAAFASCAFPIQL